MDYTSDEEVSEREAFKVNLGKTACRMTNLDGCTRNVRNRVFFPNNASTTCKYSAANSVDETIKSMRAKTQICLYLWLACFMKIINLFEFVCAIKVPKYNKYSGSCIKLYSRISLSVCRLTNQYNSGACKSA